MTVRDSDALVDRLAATIQARVLAGEIRSGTRLRQESLATEFGVSRTPVREALRKLQASGVVRLEPNRGAIVHGPTGREIRDAYQVRAELEGLAAELAVGRIRDDQLEVMREAEQLFRRSVGTMIDRRRDGERALWSSESDWERANNAFHQVIHEAAGNARLLATIAELHLSFPRDLTWTALSQSSHLLQENIEQHGRILAAIERRDGPEARATMRGHVLSAGEVVARRFDESAATAAVGP